MDPFDSQTGRIERNMISLHRRSLSYTSLNHLGKMLSKISDKLPQICHGWDGNRGCNLELFKESNLRLLSPLPRPREWTTLDLTNLERPFSSGNCCELMIDDFV